VPAARCYRAAVPVSVVIPALDEADRIGAAVASAREPGVEVLVVDGGSRDATGARARAAGARVVASPAGRARQLATGVEAATGEILVFLHADSRLPAGFAAAVEGALSDPSVAGGAFRFRFEREADGRLAAALRVVEWGARLRVALFALPYGDQGLFCRRVTLAAAGGIPQVPIMEDLDLVRAWKRIGRVVTLALAVETSPRRYQGRGPLRTMLRNWGAALAFCAGADRVRVAAWYRR